MSLLRRYLRTISLRRRVAALTAFAVTVAVVITGVAAYATTRLALYNELDTELTALARSAAATVGTDVRGLGGLTGEALQAGNVSVAVISAQGAVTLVPDELVTLAPGPQELTIARLQSGSTARTAVASNGQLYRMVAVPIPGLDYALVLGRPLTATDLILRSLWLVLVIFGAVAIVLAGLTGSAVARSGLRPLRRLTDAVEQVAATDDLAPIAVTGRDEMSPAGRVLQPDGPVAEPLPGAAAAADRRRRARATDAADQPADQRRTAGLRRRPPDAPAAGADRDPC